MKEKLFLGIDVGTNSSGYCLVEYDEQEENGQILGIGSRPIPVDSEYLGKWSRGNSISPNASRRTKRGARRLVQRYKLRRERLVTVCKIIGLIDDYDIGNTKIEYTDSLKKAVAFDLGLTDFRELPEDLIIYYLRQLALSEALPPQYLFKVLYHLNQRRGFKSGRKEQLREEGSEKTEKVEVVKTVMVQSVEDSKEKSSGKIIYKITVQSDDEIFTGTTLNADIVAYLNRTLELKITTVTTGKDTKTKRKEYKTTFTIPSKTDWTFRRDTLNDEILKSGKTIGAFFYQKIIEGYREQKFYKIRDNIVLRDRYTEEFDAIWTCQTKLNPRLLKTDKLPEIAFALYPNNPQKQKEILNLSYGNVIKKDIIYYKRDLKKQIVGTCTFEELKKVAPKSCPLNQEYRLWQLVNNLKIHDENKFLVRELSVKEKEKAFDYLNARVSCDQKALFTELFGKNPCKQQFNYRDGKVFTGNVTRAKIKSKLEKLHSDPNLFLNTPQYLEHIWHVLHSVESSNEDVVKALLRYFQKEKVTTFTSEMAEGLATLSFEAGYASLCTRAIKKLLPIMQAGKYFNPNNIWQDARFRMDNLMADVYDDSVGIQTRASLEGKTTIQDFQGMLQPHAVALVYGTKLMQKELFTHPSDIKLFKHNSLRNPVVEQILNETLQIVKEVWAHFGRRPDVIRVELARDLKLSAKERESRTVGMEANEKTNNAIRNILRELKVGGDPSSTTDVQKFKMWAELGNAQIKEISKTDVDKYKMWKEADFKSPYTGKTIPLEILFTDAIQIEHIIPKARFFDDSLNNKTICEAAVNSDKDDSTAFEYMTKQSANPNFNLLKFETFKATVIKTFSPRKAKQFLMEQIPDDFVERQLNDTRIIGVRLVEVLRFITPDVYTTTGSITDLLKHQWGLTELFKEMLKERYTKVANKAKLDVSQTIFLKDILKDKKPTGKKTLVIKGFSKRADHRHHALDAVVIACTMQSHVQKLNQLNVLYDRMEDRNKRNEAIKTQIESLRKFKPLWKTFRTDVKDALESIIVPTKNKRNLITRKKHKHYKIIDGKKILVPQTKGDNIVVRGSLHNDTYYGEALVMKKIDHIPDFIKTCFSERSEIKKDRKGYLTAFIEKRIAYEHQQKALLLCFEECEYDQKKILESMLKKPLVNPLNGKILRGVVTNERKFASRCELNEKLSLGRLLNMVDKKLQAEIIDHIIETDTWVFAKDPKLVTGVTKEMILKIPVTNDEDSDNDNEEKEDTDDGKDKNKKKITKAIENALGTEGLLRFNDKRREAANKIGADGKRLVVHPVYKVRFIEDVSKEVGESTNTKVNLVRKNANNSKMHVAPGDNYALGVYTYLKDGKMVRDREVLSFFDAVKKATKGEPLFEKVEGATLFTLVKRDLVYVPNPDESIASIDWTDRKKLFPRIWRLVKMSKQVYFVPHNVSNAILYKNKNGTEINEFGSQGSVEFIDNEDGTRTKIIDVCIRLKVDRLGLSIVPVFDESV